MKIEVSFRAKIYSFEFKEVLEVKDILGAIRQKNKIKKCKKIVFCNQHRSFEEEEKIGELHDDEIFYIVEILEIKKPKYKKPKKEDLAEIIKKCTGAKDKLETNIFDRHDTSERHSLRAEMIRSAFVGRVNSHSNPNLLNSTVPTRENIDRLLEMGFTEENAKAALTRTRNDLSTAIELIMDNQLINPEARNDDFRMNANNSNILANIPNNNIINSNANTNDGIIPNSGSVRNETLRNNIDSLDRIPNILEFSTEDNRPNIFRSYDSRVNEINNNLNFNTNNNRRVNFNFDLEHNDSDSLGLFDGLESYDISFPLLAPNIRANRNSYIHGNDSQYPSRVSGSNWLRNDHINRNAFIRPQTREYNSIFNPIEEINPQTEIRNPYNDNSHTNFNYNNNIINRSNNNNLDVNTNNGNVMNNNILYPTLISNNNNRNGIDQNQDTLNTEFDMYYNDIINVIDEVSNNRAPNISSIEVRNTNTNTNMDNSIFPSNSNINSNTQIRNLVENRNIKNKIDVNQLEEVTSSTNNKIIENTSFKKALNDQNNKLNDTISSANSGGNSPFKDINKINTHISMDKNTENNNINLSSNVQINSSNKDVKKQTNNIFKIISEKNSIIKPENNIDNSVTQVINDNNPNLMNNNNLNNKNIFSITNSNHEKINKANINLNLNNNIQNPEENLDCNKQNLLNNISKDIKSEPEINRDLNIERRQNSNEINNSSYTNNLLSNFTIFNTISNNLINTERSLDINHTSNPSTINNSFLNSGNNIFTNEVNNNTSNNNNLNSLLFNPQNTISRIPVSYEGQGANFRFESLPANNNSQNLFDFRASVNNNENIRDINNNSNRLRNFRNTNRNDNNSLNINDIYENVINTNLNGNFNPFERPINRGVVTNAIRFENPGANIYSARYTEQFRRNRDIANFIYEGLESEGSSSEDQNIFGNSLNNLVYYNPLNRRRNRNGIYRSMETNTRNLMRNRTDLYSDLTISPNPPVERADNILDNLRHFNSSTFSNYDILASDNNSNFSESSNSNDFL